MSKESPASSPRSLDIKMPHPPHSHPPITDTVSTAPTYPPQAPSSSIQPSIDLVEQDARAEELLATCDESTAVGKPFSTPVESRSFFYQTLFVSVVCFPQVIAEAHIGMLLVPLVDIGRQVNTEDEHQLSWFPAAYGLTVGVFLIAGGRMGDIYGSKLLWTLGIALCAIANLASGFCDTKIPFNICRALAGIGVAASLPNAIAILGKAYGSSRTRAIVFSILGALAPAGFVIGGLIGGFFTELTDTRWIWWFTAILCAVIGALGAYMIPASRSLRQIPFDYLGALLLVLSLGLFNFAWNQGPVVGWPTPYVYVLLIASFGFGVAFWFWEKRVGSEKALVPPAVLTKNNLLVYLCLWLGWMSFGIYALYLVLFLRNIRGFENTLILAAQISPSFPAGVFFALFCPYAVRHYKGHAIFFVSMLSFCAGNLMAALTPVNLSYWAVTFPSLLAIAAGPDLSYTTSQLIVTSSVGPEFHGIAGGLVMMCVYFSQSIGQVFELLSIGSEGERGEGSWGTGRSGGRRAREVKAFDEDAIHAFLIHLVIALIHSLGMAATVERYVAHGDQLKGYRGTFWLGTAMAGFAALIVAIFIRMGKQAHSHH